MPDGHKHAKSDEDFRGGIAMREPRDELVPEICTVTEITDETPDTKTFRVEAADGGGLFGHMPGQCAMLGVPGAGEAMFSISSSPTDGGHKAFSIKRVGALTAHLHGLSPGAQLAIRGPYGRPFPVGDMAGKGLLFVAGGIGLAPLRSVIRYCFHHRESYGDIDIVYGARSAPDMVFFGELMQEWPKMKDTNVYPTIDRPQDGWGGHVGFVPAYLEELAPRADRTALICGPPVMIKYALESLAKIGFKKEQVYTTLEMKMKCGIGKCGRCNLGPKYICKDGPVFRCDELEGLPEEY